MTGVNTLVYILLYYGQKYVKKFIVQAPSAVVIIKTPILG
jgi:hypothetical protein